STSFRERGRPSPVPSARLPSVACLNSSKIVSSSSGAMPGPVSATAISTWPSSSRAETSTRPSAGVNLTALDTRLKTIWRTRRPQLGRHRGQGVRLVPARALQFLIQELQLVAQPVHVRGQRTDLVPVRHLQLPREVAGGDRGQPPLRLLQRDEERVRQEQREN